MAYCKNCINAVESNLPEGGLYCTMFRSLCGDTIGCSSGVDGKRKAKTNADRIRSMSDEELAEFISGVEAEAIRRTGLFITVGDIQRGKEGWLDWLRQEADHE